MTFVSLLQVASLVLVGVLWGCTNPILLRKKQKQGVVGTTTITTKDDDASSQSAPQPIFSWLPENVRCASVWLPYYVLNQLGSVVFYFCLSTSDLSVTVPICNALALLFSILTSVYMGEPLRSPVRVILGAALVMAGTMVCLQASSSSSPKE